MTIDLNTKQQNVLNVIKRHPEAANNDMLLYEFYWLEVDGWRMGNSVARNTRPETISRRRRELFNMGLISYDGVVEKQREEAFINERDRASRYDAVSWLSDTEECGA